MAQAIFKVGLLRFHRKAGGAGAEDANGGGELSMAATRQPRRAR